MHYIMLLETWPLILLYWSDGVWPAAKWSAREEKDCAEGEEDSHNVHTDFQSVRLLSGEQA